MEKTVKFEGGDKGRNFPPLGLRDFFEIFGLREKNNALQLFIQGTNVFCLKEKFSKTSNPSEEGRDLREKK